MKSNFDDVCAFHVKFKLGQSGLPTLPDPKWFMGRVEMILEELTETCRAVRNNDLCEFADGMIDLVYFIMGTAAHCGIPWQELWDEVQRANMDKELQPSNKLGRRKNNLDVIKPEGWRPPNHQRIIDRAIKLGLANVYREGIE